MSEPFDPYATPAPPPAPAPAPAPPYSPYPTAYPAHYPAQQPIQPSPAGPAHGFPAGGYEPGQYSHYSQLPIYSPPPPKSHRGRNIALGVGGGIVGLIVVIAVVATLFTDSSASKRIALPSSFGAYTKLDNAAAHKVESSLRSMGQNSNVGLGTFIDDSSIGSYASTTGDIPSLLAVTLPTSRFAAANDHATFVDQFLTGAVPADQMEHLPAGSHGGAVACGYAVFGAAHETMCSWSDAETSGLLVSVDVAGNHLSTQQLDAVAQSFRDSVD